MKENLASARLEIENLKKELDKQETEKNRADEEIVALREKEKESREVHLKSQDNSSVDQKNYANALQENSTLRSQIEQKNQEYQALQNKYNQLKRRLAQISSV